MNAALVQAHRTDTAAEPTIPAQLYPEMPPLVRPVPEPARATSGAAGVAKTAFDVVAAVAILLALTPLMVALAVAVRRDGGPAFFRQTRVGLDGREFTMVKFRSMIVDAEGALAGLIGANEATGPLFKIRQDPRITRVGARLRKYSLDELPQLFNVITGSMSLIGPQPSLPGEVATYDNATRRRLTVKPGMTGLWQVSGRSDLSWDESIRLDLHYVDTWSPRLDVAILARTARTVLQGSGAY